MNIVWGHNKMLASSLGHRGWSRHGLRGKDSWLNIPTEQMLTLSPLLQFASWCFNMLSKGVKSEMKKYVTDSQMRTDGPVSGSGSHCWFFSLTYKDD